MGNASLAQELLREFLESGSHPEARAADDALADLMVDHALPVIRRVVERRLTGAPRDAIEDVCGNAATSLIARLRRHHPSQAPIEDFAAYAASVATRAVAEHLASKSPERARLRRKLRLLCSSADRFFVGEVNGRWTCGLTLHRTRDCVSAAAAEECRSQLAATRLPADFTELARLVFGTLSAPLDLTDATSLFGDLLGIAGAPQSLDALVYEPAATPDTPPPSRPQWAQKLWSEIGSLPLGQRSALLLNLRMPDGSAIELLEEVGVADIGSLAEVLGMPREELAGLWGKLPLDDLQIAARLGVTRQQVINLRSSARERLRRRTRGDLPTSANIDRKTTSIN